MLDPRLLRNQIDDVRRQLARRGFAFDAVRFQELEGKRKDAQIHVQKLQAQRNDIAKQIGIAKSKGGEVKELLEQASAIPEELKQRESELSRVQEQLDSLLMEIPNIPHETVTDGKNEAGNVEVRRWGERRHFAFTPKDHVDLGVSLGMLDLDAAAKIAGARFAVMKGALARLQRALIQYMLELHTRHHEYQEVYVPYLVNADSMRGTGQLPKFEADLFSVDDEAHYYLIPTAEVPVTNLVRDTIVDAEIMPLKFVCHTPCFRSEAGSHGKDTRGMIRQHQFEKVELVQIARPEESFRAMEELTGHAERVLQELKLPYRVVELCAGDLGFAAVKTYDIEVWLAGQNAYREISSCSNFGDFQARRMQARWRNPITKKPELVHTLNGSALAVGRTLIAVMENYQEADGSITVPTVLHSYMGGAGRIGPE
jgi:seryl-tRNA synthetase